MALVQTKHCRLCAIYCDEPKNIYDANGHGNELHEIIYKYFHPRILNMETWKQLSGICVTCSHYIENLDKFEKIILKAQLELRQFEGVGGIGEFENKAATSTASPRIKIEDYINLADADNELCQTTEDDAANDDRFLGQAIFTIKEIDEENQPSFKITEIDEKHQEFEYEEKPNMSLNTSDSVNLLKVTDTRSQANLPAEIKSNELALNKDEGLFAQPKLEIMDVHDKNAEYEFEANSNDESCIDRSVAIKNSIVSPHMSIKQLNSLIAKCIPNLKCELCSKPFQPRLLSLESHFCKLHPKHKFYIICCQRNLVGLPQIREHMLQHNDQIVQCNNTFATQRTLNLHQNKYIELIFKCDDICGFTFKHRSALMRHIAEKHNNGIAKFECKTCGQYFPTAKILEIHHAWQHTAGIPCDFCWISCSTPGAVTRHMIRKHSELQQFVCNKCNEGFKTKAAFRKHRCYCQLEKKTNTKSKNDNDQSMQGTLNDATNKTNIKTSVQTAASSEFLDESKAQQILDRSLHNSSNAKLNNFSKDADKASKHAKGSKDTDKNYNSKDAKNNYISKDTNKNYNSKDTEMTSGTKNVLNISSEYTELTSGIKRKSIDILTASDAKRLCSSSNTKLKTFSKDTDLTPGTNRNANSMVTPAIGKSSINTASSEFLDEPKNQHMLNNSLHSSSNDKLNAFSKDTEKISCFSKDTEKTSFSKDTNKISFSKDTKLTPGTKIKATSTIAAATAESSINMATTANSEFSDETQNQTLDKYLSNSSNVNLNTFSQCTDITLEIKRTNPTVVKSTSSDVPIMHQLFDESLHNSSKKTQLSSKNKRETNDVSIAEYCEYSGDSLHSSIKNTELISKTKNGTNDVKIAPSNGHNTSKVKLQTFNKDTRLPPGTKRKATNMITAASSEFSDEFSSNNVKFNTFSKDTVKTSSFSKDTYQTSSFSKNADKISSFSKSTEKTPETTGKPTSILPASNSATSDVPIVQQSFDESSQISSNAELKTFRKFTNNTSVERNTHSSNHMTELVTPEVCPTFSQTKFQCQRCAESFNMEASLGLHYKSFHNLFKVPKIVNTPTTYVIKGVDTNTELFIEGLNMSSSMSAELGNSKSELSSATRVELAVSTTSTCSNEAKLCEVKSKSALAGKDEGITVSKIVANTKGDLNMKLSLANEQTKLNDSKLKVQQFGKSLKFKTNTKILPKLGLNVKSIKTISKNKTENSSMKLSSTKKISHDESSSSSEEQIPTCSSSSRTRYQANLSKFRCPNCAQDLINPTQLVKHTKFCNKANIASGETSEDISEASLHSIDMDWMKSSTLILHPQINTTFICVSCGKGFRSQVTLKLHCKILHKQEELPSGLEVPSVSGLTKSLFDNKPEKEEAMAVIDLDSDSDSMH